MIDGSKEYVSMGNLANKIRYNRWMRKLDEYAHYNKSFGYIEESKLFAQVRSGKLTPAQCDSIMDRNECLRMNSLDRRTVKCVIEEVLGEEYTLDYWTWGDDKHNLYIHVRESERFLELVLNYTQESIHVYEWYKGEGKSRGDMGLYCFSWNDIVGIGDK
jgi:hypothetical protein